MDTVVKRDNVRKTAVKENNDGGWSSDDIVLGLGRRKNRDTVE
jgi:hypothetical protein